MNGLLVNRIWHFVVMLFCFIAILYNVDMLKIVGNEIFRNNQKVGWIYEEHHIRSHDNKQLGYFTNDFIFSNDGHKLAYIKGDYLYQYGVDTDAAGAKIPLEKVNAGMPGSILSQMAKCAIYMFIGV